MRSTSITLPAVCSALLTLLVVAGPAAAVDLEIEFRHQPDSTGQHATRQVLAIDVDDEEAEVSENGETRKVDITKAEVRELTDLVRKRVVSFKFDEGDRVARPRVEIIFEFEGHDHEIEVTEIYAAGKVPAEYLKIQERFFKTPGR
jgi:hypothetical protein